MMRWIKAVNVCDDLRWEITGKEIAIGLYAGIIGVPHIPFILPQLVLRFEFETEGVVLNRFETRITDPANQPRFAGWIEPQFKSWELPGACAIIVPGVLFQVLGAYIIWVRENPDSEWEKVRTMHVVPGVPSPTPTTAT